MKSKLPWVLLAISVLFNLAFLAGFWRTRQALNQLKTREGRIGLFIQRLRLDPGQQKATQPLTEGLVTQLRNLESSHHETIEAFWSEVAKTDPDAARVKTLLERTLEVERSAREYRTDYLLALLRHLDPEQRERCMKMVRTQDLQVK